MEIRYEDRCAGHASCSGDLKRVSNLVSAAHIDLNFRPKIMMIVPGRRQCREHLTQDKSNHNLVPTVQRMMIQN